MNTNQLKRFAQEARKKLLSQVARKLEFVLTQDTAELRGKEKQLNQLNKKIAEQGQEQVIETVAYTWFNRMMAFRFMDANGYTIPKIVTPLPGMSNPEILQNALAGQIEPELKIDRQRLNDLLDGKTAAADAHTEAYKMLLVASCNQWHQAMPFMFEQISDYTELLLPDDLLSDFSIVTDIRNGMTDEDCHQEELIGWLYQFYISDKKDAVFEGLKKNVKITAENIPAATQLFTPRWIVRYMVENTLGKIWLTLKPDSKLRQFMPYYIEAPEDNVPAPLPEGIKEVTDITFLDPCQGSGHILVYAFDLFTKIYEEEGYNTNEIPALILEHNLFGIDIDERAAQLAAFALTMKARSYYVRFLRKPVRPHVLALENVSEVAIQEAVKLPITVKGKKISDYKDLSIHLLTQADNLGSLIHIESEELAAVQIKGGIWQEQQQKLKKQAEYLSRQYHCVVTNPPYMGDSKMNKSLSNFVNSNFTDSRLDLMTCFLEKAINSLSPEGFLGMINQHSWMFISSYKELRKKLLLNISFTSMLHLGPRAFPEIGGEVVQSTAFIIQNRKPKDNFTKYFRLVQYDSTEKKRMAFLDSIESKGTQIVYKVKQNSFTLIPNNNICYWFSEKLVNNFRHDKIADLSISKAGIVSGNDADFLRLWYEISSKLINLSKNIFTNDDNVIWVPINKGGGKRKYFGNEEYIINIRNLWLEGRTGKSVRRGDPSFYYREAITWTMVCGTSFSFRHSINNTFATAAPALFFKKKELTLYTLGFLNSKISMSILPGINPTINLGSGDVSRLPLILDDRINGINQIVVDNIELTKLDWNSRETSWHFRENEIIKHEKEKISEAFNVFSSFWFELFLRIKTNEEELNRQFIEIYGLQDELTPDVPLKEITILQEESKIINEELFIDPVPVLKQLLSYSIGCVFGRYSLDKHGLILSNQGETLQDFLNQVSNSSFTPDEDNIIPVLEDEWFSDDIVGRFKVFLKIAFGVEHFEENLRYIEDTIGKDIRKYFVKDFYNDHIKRYKKRPIYWMFSSPNGHFKALMYMHRYTPDLCSKMLNNYLHAFMGKLEAAKQTQTMLSLREDISTREKTAAIKQIDKLELMLKDCRAYEKALFTVATQKINIDLDDGVKVNYQKFKEVLVPIKGLEKKEE